MFNLKFGNPEQRKAIRFIDGLLLILAGAGSGKTHTISARMAFMLTTCNISPKNIIGIILNNKATWEMKERVKTLISPGLANELTISTFHSLSIKILQKHITKIGYQTNLSIHDTSNQLAIICHALFHYRLSKKFNQKKYSKRPLLLKLSNSAHEAQAIIDDITSKISQEENLNDIAILYRSNTQAQVFEDELRIGQIPYKMLGGQKFYEKKEIKDLICLPMLIF